MRHSSALGWQHVGPLAGLHIRHVDRPTTRITDSVQRIDLRDTAYGRASRGEYGPMVQQGVQRSLPGKYPLSAAQKDIIDHLALLQANPVAADKAPISADPQGLAHHIKSLAYFLKADAVGTCRVPVSAYYSCNKQGERIAPQYENTVVFLMRKDALAMRASTGTDWMGDPISFQPYGHLALVAETIANYVRRLGWDASAQYGPSFVDRYSVLMPPLLLEAGLGEISRAGIVLNPHFGLGFKAAAVLTNMPLVPDKPIDFGLQSFCHSCRICAQSCPSRAISTGAKVLYNGYETWKLDTQRCASLNFTNKRGTMCNRCVKSCPWTRPVSWPYSLVRSLVTRSRLAQRMAIAAPGLFGPAGELPDQKWWFDLEYIGDVLESRANGGE